MQGQKKQQRDIGRSGHESNLTKNSSPVLKCEGHVDFGEGSTLEAQTAFQLSIIGP